MTRAEKLDEMFATVVAGVEKNALYYKTSMLARAAGSPSRAAIEGLLPREDYEALTVCEYRALFARVEAFIEAKHKAAT